MVGAILCNNYYLQPREAEASTELAKSQELFGQAQYEKALAGFQKVASDYSSTDAGNLAQLYIGLCQANLGKWQEAVNALESFSGNDNNSLSPTFLIQAGEILESQGKKDEALKLYQEVKEKYFNSMQYQTIDEYIERASAK